MCLILAGSSSLTSLVREAATKRPLQPRQPIRAGYTVENSSQRKRLLGWQVWESSTSCWDLFEGTEQGIKWWGVEATSGGFDAE